MSIIPHHGLEVRVESRTEKHAWRQACQPTRGTALLCCMVSFCTVRWPYTVDRPWAWLLGFDEIPPAFVTHRRSLLTFVFARLLPRASWVLQALLNVDDLALSALQEELSQTPALARRECLKRCSHVDDDDNLSYDI